MKKRYESIVYYYSSTNYSFTIHQAPTKYNIILGMHYIIINYNTKIHTFHKIKSAS